MRTLIPTRPQTAIYTFGRAVLVTGLFVFAASPAAANWRIGPSIAAGLEYDDNAILFAESAVDSSVNGYLIEADTDFIYDTQLTDFTLTPRVRITRYDEFSDLDSEDYFLDFGYDRTGQRSRFRLLGTYGDESTRTAERSDVDFDVDDPEAIPDDESGRTLNTQKRQRIQVRPEWSYQTGQRTLFRLGGRYIDVSYDDRLVQFNTDYSETTGMAGLDYNWSERSALTLDGYYRENEFDRLDRDFSGYGATIGLNRSLNEKTSLIMNVGVDSTEDAAGDKQSNPVGAISLVRNMETSRVVAALRRTVTGSGAGVISVRDSINLNFTRDLSEKLSTGLGVAAYQTDKLDESVADFDERDYIQLRGLLTWHLSRAFSVDMEYSYTSIDRASFDDAEDSNRFNLWFRYQPEAR